MLSILATKRSLKAAFERYFGSSKLSNTRNLKTFLSCICLYLKVSQRMPSWWTEICLEDLNSICIEIFLLFCQSSIFTCQVSKSTEQKQTDIRETIDKKEVSHHSHTEKRMN